MSSLTLFLLWAVTAGPLLLGNGVVEADIGSLTGANYNGWVYPIRTPQSSLNSMSPPATRRTPDVIISTPQEGQQLPSASDSGLGDVNTMNLPYVPALLAGIRQRIQQTQTLLTRMGLQDVAKGHPPPSLYPEQEESPNTSAVLTSSPTPVGQSDSPPQAQTSTGLPPLPQSSPSVPSLDSNLNSGNKFGGLVSSSQQQTTLPPTLTTESGYTLVYSG